TGIAFSNFNSTNYSQSGSLANIINTNIYDWKNNLKNDFEQTVFQTNPILKEIKESMYAQGAIYSAMSGTGSTIFAIFEKTTLLQLKYPAHYFYQIV
ncbi:MAG: 4-(cytidine 5'-diphospho)-2-C-methyl-D-erythritol kinase, partial [Ferruginibacter sp.]